MWAAKEVARDPFASLEAVVRPAAELEVALLLVEGEVLDVHLARRREDGGRRPLDAPVVVDDGLRHRPDYEVAIGAVTNALLMLVVVMLQG